MECVSASLLRFFLKHKNYVIVCIKRMKPASGDAAKLIQETAAYLQKHKKRLYYGPIRRGGFDNPQTLLYQVQRHLRGNNETQACLKTTSLPTSQISSAARTTICAQTMCVSRNTSLPIPLDFPIVRECACCLRCRDIRYSCRLTLTHTMHNCATRNHAHGPDLCLHLHLPP